MLHVERFSWQLLTLDFNAECGCSCHQQRYLCNWRHCAFTLYANSWLSFAYLGRTRSAEWYAGFSSLKDVPDSRLAAVLINPANYPALDRPPPTDSPQVQQWLSEIDLSGVPNWSPTQPGGCANASNAQAVSEASSRCWWTCGGCNRATDVSYCPTTGTWGVRV